MKLLTSDKFALPVLYYITDREMLKDVPPGVPFIYGTEENEKHIVRILEYEVLYQEAMKSGYPFNFRQILLDNGYTGLQDFYFNHPLYLEYTSEDTILGEDYDIDKSLCIDKDNLTLNDFIRDSAVYVDITKLKDLNVFPTWLNTIEEAVHTNIHNFAVFNNNMYNKKLEGMYGSLELTSPGKNLIIIDISGSIPKGVSATCLALAKNLAETFYSDLLITGSKSTIYPYEDINSLDIENIYSENGMDNDQTYFKKLVTSDERSYKTAIVFGDNHSPCNNWSNAYNTRTKTISRENGKKLCKWKIDKLISFHTKSTEEIAGYADWFEPIEIKHIEDWVKYLNKV